MPTSRFWWRLIVAALGFVAAVATGFVTLVVAVVIAPIVHAAVAGMPPIDLHTLFRLLRGVDLFAIAVTAIWPAWALLAILIEAAALRGLLLHFAAFAGVAVVAVLGLSAIASPASIETAAASGLVAGFAHWLVAGRGAGFRDPRSASAEGGDPRRPHA